MSEHDKQLLAIYAEEQPVGFVMLAYGITGYEEPSIAVDNYCIMRLMIDEQYQNRGYGREAMKKILEFIRTFPAGPAHLLLDSLYLG